MTYILKTANLIFIAVTVYFGVTIFYTLLTAQFDSVFLPVERDSGPIEMKEEAYRSLSDYRAIAQRNLFQTKDSDSKNKTDPVRITALEPTTLKLKLWGTVINNSGQSYAVIEDMKEKKQNLYKPGDMIQNAELREILREKVIFRIGTRDEILEMEKIPGGSKTPERMVAIAETEKTQNITLKRSSVDNAVQDINNLMKQVKIRPHPEGLSLTGIDRNSIFAQMGLRNGDVIVGLDGQDIQSVDDALQLYDHLRTSTNVSVKIKRRGRLENLDYTIE